jgi:fimbrial chaperone protein
MRTFPKVLTVSCLLLLLAGPSFAGSYSVMPARIYMTPADRAAVVTVTNDGDEPLVLQADVQSWRQKPDGKDDLQPSDEMVLSPPILTVMPRSSQVLRLLRTGKPKLGPEQSYRFFLHEVVEARPSTTPGLQFALAYSMPVFITPQGSKPKLSCKPETSADGKVRAVCENTGFAHSRVHSVTLVDAGGTKHELNVGNGYVLAQNSRVFDLKTPARVADGKATLEVVYPYEKPESFDGSVGK